MLRDHTRGSLARSVVRLAVPAMSNHFLLVAFQAVDLAWVGRLGPEALAAVSSATFLFWCLLALTEAISIGTGSLVGRAAGAGDRRGVLDLSSQGLLLALLWSVLSSALVDQGPFITQGAQKFIRPILLALQGIGQSFQGRIQEVEPAQSFRFV